MNISYNELPVKHIIIDGFMSNKAANECLAEFIRLEPFYKSASVKEDEDVRTDTEFRKQTIRDNSVVYLNEHMVGRENESFILNAMHDKILNLKFINWFNDLPGLFPILEHVNSSDTLLSRYGQCDFYGIHNDQINNEEYKRILTMVYYVNKPGAKFSGGELTLYNKDLKQSVSIEPKHNRCVIFESKQFHSVESVILNGDFADGRFSVNFWLGFDSVYRFK